MNQKQYERALEAVRNDCAIQRKLIDDYGNTCAVGAMALAAGYTPHSLRRLRTYNGIAKRYGLQEDELRPIWRVNDHEYNQSDRRLAVANVLHSIARSYNLELKPEGEEQCGQ